ncbi:MAG: hypothetical protein AAF492_12725, partial [Verrucomicrobiota bacterium]
MKIDRSARRANEHPFFRSGLSGRARLHGVTEPGHFILISRQVSLDVNEADRTNEEHPFSGRNSGIHIDSCPFVMNRVGKTTR